MDKKSPRPFVELPERIAKQIAGKYRVPEPAKIDLDFYTHGRLIDSGILYPAGRGVLTDKDGLPVASALLDISIPENDPTGSKFDSGPVTWAVTDEHGSFRPDSLLSIGSTKGTFTLRVSVAGMPDVAAEDEFHVSGQQPAKFAGNAPTQYVPWGQILDFVTDLTLRDTLGNPVGYGWVDFVIDDPSEMGAFFVDGSDFGKFRIGRELSPEGLVIPAAGLVVFNPAAGKPFWVNISRGGVTRKIQFGADVKP